MKTFKLEFALIWPNGTLYANYRTADNAGDGRLDIAHSMERLGIPLEYAPEIKARVVTISETDWLPIVEADALKRMLEHDYEADLRDVEAAEDEDL